MPQRNVTITANQERFIESALQSGQFSNIDEVFQTALNLLESEREIYLIKNKMTNKKIDQGIESYKSGDYTEVKNKDELDEFFDDMRKERKQTIKEQSK